MKNWTQYLMYVLILIGVIVFLISFFSDEMEPQHNAMIVYSYILAAVCTVVALGAVFMGAAAKPAMIKPSIIGIGAFLIVIGLSYVLASDVVLEDFAVGTSASTSKWTGVGLIASYILAALAIGSVLYSSVARFMK